MVEQEKDVRQRLMLEQVHRATHVVRGHTLVDSARIRVNKLLAMLPTKIGHPARHFELRIRSINAENTQLTLDLLCECHAGLPANENEMHQTDHSNANSRSFFQARKPLAV